MNIHSDKQLDILNDHYKDTCERIRENVSLRDRLFLFALLLIGFNFFQLTDSKTSSQVMISFLKEQTGLQLAVNIEILSAILWFLLLSIVVRYFQANVYVNRQYDYLHSLEKKIEDLVGHPLLSREGSSYLSKYPLFSNWTHFLYTWAFPSLLLLTVTFKIYKDWPGCENLIGAYTISFISFLMIVISTILYLIFLHRKKE